jgi:DNA invertase Pin-like site-specific DNA recombinase
MKTKKNKYYAYVRVSTVKQGDGASLEAQSDAIRQYADKHGLVISEWFRETETAAKSGRPVFEKIIKQLNSKKADGLLMHKIDRSARNLRDWATVGDLQDSGIEIHFAAESVDFTSRGGRLTADIQAVIAADFIRNLKEEIRKGQRARLKQGYYPFTAPFGYLDNGKGELKTIDTEHGIFVREMFELYATGQYSLPSLESEMYKRGLRSKSGCKVYKGKIELILANPFYMGLIKIRGHPGFYQGKHKPVISPELFRKVQNVKQNRSRRKNTKHNHLYRGIFACKKCKNSMIPEKQRGHVYYRCHTKSCPPNSINETFLEDEILNSLALFQLSEEDYSTLQKNLDKLSTTETISSFQKSVRLELSKIEGQLEKLMDGFINGLIEENVFSHRKEKLEFKKIETSKRSENQISIAEKIANTQKFLEHVKSVASTYVYANPSEKRQLIDLLFSNMFVFNKKVEIATQNWLMPYANIAASPKCADYKVKNRSGLQLHNSESGENNMIQFLNITDGIKVRELAR